MGYGSYRLHRSLLLYVPPILILLGTFGNVFSFVILKSKAMLKFSTYFFLMLMAVTDTLVLYVGLLPLWVSQVSGLDIRNMSNFVCKVSNSFGSMVSDCSVWLIISVSVERYLVVCHPFRASALCSADTAKRIAILLVVAFLLLNVHFLWTVHVQEYSYGQRKITQCYFTDRWIEEAWPWVDAIVYSILPFFIILFFNVLIVRHVLIARGQRNTLQNIYPQRRPSQEGSTRLTLMLLTVSLSFLLTTLPTTVVSICAQFWDPSSQGDLSQRASYQLKRTITELLMYANHSINFYLYCATGQKFRHQLAWMVCYRHPAATQGGGGGGGGRAADQTSVSKIGSVQERSQQGCQLRRSIRLGRVGGPYSGCCRSKDVFSLKVEYSLNKNFKLRPR